MRHRRGISATEGKNDKSGIIIKEKGAREDPMAKAAKRPAIAYLRTSSAANVGTDKDSDKRQRQAIEAFARQGGYEIVGEFYDAAVSGADAIETRPGFAAMLERIEGNGVRVVDRRGCRPIRPLGDRPGAGRAGDAGPRRA